MTVRLNTTKNRALNAQQELKIHRQCASAHPRTAPNAQRELKILRAKQRSGTQVTPLFWSDKQKVARARQG